MKKPRELVQPHLKKCVCVCVSDKTHSSRNSTYLQIGKVFKVDFPILIKHHHLVESLERSLFIFCLYIIHTPHDNI